MSANEGGGFDFNRLAQQMGLGMGGGGAAPQGADAPVKSFDELIERIFDLAAKWVGRAVNVKSDSILSTGPAGLDISKAGIQVNNQMIRQFPDVNGGVIANSLFDGLQVASVKDFSKVSASSGGEAASSGASFADISGIAGGMQNYSGSSMSEASLGDLHPSAGRGQSQSSGMQV